MVGEIRDLETAEIAVQASLTGHMVMSTLHTNTAVGAITRLVDMGVEPYPARDQHGRHARAAAGSCACARIAANRSRADSFECQFLGIDYAQRADDLSGSRMRAVWSQRFSWSHRHLRTGRRRRCAARTNSRPRLGTGIDASRSTHLPRNSRGRPRQDSERRDDGSGNPARHAGRLTGHGRLRVHRPRRGRTPEKRRHRSRQRPADPPDSARPGTRAVVGRYCDGARDDLLEPTFSLATRDFRAGPCAVHAPDVDVARRIAPGRRGAAGRRAANRKEPHQHDGDGDPQPRSRRSLAGVESRRIPQRVFASVPFDGDGGGAVRPPRFGAGKSGAATRSAAMNRRATSKWRCSIR